MTSPTSVRLRATVLDRNGAPAGDVRVDFAFGDDPNHHDESAVGD